MQIISLIHDRRHFLRMTAAFSTGAMLAGCGGGGSTGTAVVVVPTPVATAPVAPPVAGGVHPLNLALNLAYIGAQYYGFAARGAGLPANLTSGIGREGAATGARQASFGDAIIAAYAEELASDKQQHVIVLRGQIGLLAAAQPALDLSGGSAGAFSIAAQGAGIVGTGSAFDPYAGDDNFLLGAFLVENAVAAAYRTLLTQIDEPATLSLVATNLADAIYHGGLIRSLLEDRVAANASIGISLSNTAAMFAALDGSNVGDQMFASARGASSNIQDAGGRPIPFTRANAQILKALYLSSSKIGGFLPAGANGVAA